MFKHTRDYARHELAGLPTTKAEAVVEAAAAVEAASPSVTRERSGGPATRQRAGRTMDPTAGDVGNASAPGPAVGGHNSSRGWEFTRERSGEIPN